MSKLGRARSKSDATTSAPLYPTHIAVHVAGVLKSVPPAILAQTSGPSSAMFVTVAYGPTIVSIPILFVLRGRDFFPLYPRAGYSMASSSPA